jgi:glycosyltransferase involved in cell wall biosynthesis
VPEVGSGEVLQGEDIIYVCEGDWSFERGGHMSSFFPRLLEENRILYIDLPTSSQIFYKSPKTGISRLGKWLQGLEELRSDFYSYSPFPVVPLGDRSSISNKINALILAPFFKGVANELGFRRPVLIFQRFNSAELIGLWNEKVSCYLCVDDYSFRADPNVRDTDMIATEKKLLERVDVVFTTSHLLYEDKKKTNSHTHLLPNAADSQYFSRALLPETPVPEDVGRLDGPILGLVGTTPGRIDFDLLKFLAEKEPKWQIVLIGYLHSPELERLTSLKNVHFLGWREYSQIPSYLKAFDVCLIPFKVNKQTHTMNPYKLYEYVAAGKPVVTTDLYELERFEEKYPGTVYVAHSHQEFYEKSKQALEEDKEKVLPLRMQAAGENTWEKRLEDMSRIIYERLEAKTQDSKLKTQDTRA